MDFVEVLRTPDKSEDDKKDYRMIKLKSNGLKALLISQSKLYGKVEKEEKVKTKKKRVSSELMAAVAMNVDVGSFYDFTTGVPGMAHFCEHMMFLGSEKYPEENGLDKYLKEHGGQSNASTLSEHTVYVAEVLENGLEGALDRIGSVFTKPLLLKETMTREREAVESEFQLRRDNVDIHMEQLLISYGSSKHPSSNFYWGNSRSLKEDVTDDELHERTKAFHQKYYIANRMYLCIQSKLSLDKLQKLTVKYFNDIPHNFESDVDISSSPEYSHENAFKVEFFEKTHCLNSAIEENRLVITWVLPPMLDKYKSKPLEFVKSILESEDDGTLVDYLTKNELAYGLDIELDYADYEFNSLYTLFKIQINLKDQGKENPEEVLDAIFSYLLFLKEQDVDEDFYNYLHNTANLEFFKYYESSPFENVEFLAGAMKYYEPADILTGYYLYQEFNKEDIMAVIERLNEQKFNLQLVSEDCESDYTEKWFQFGYSESDVPQAWLDAWKNRKVKKEFALPEPGEAVMKFYRIYGKSMKFKNSSIYPVKVFENQICEAWHRLDDKFLEHTAFVNINFVSAYPIKSLKNYALLRLFFTLFDQLTDKVDYPSSIDDASFQCLVTFTGFRVEIIGHHRGIQNIVKIIVNVIAKMSSATDSELFESLVENLKESTVASVSDPDSLVDDYLASVVDTKFHTEYEVNAILDDLKYASFKAFYINWLRESKVQILAQGNILKSHVTDLASLVMKHMQFKPVKSESSIVWPARVVPQGRMSIELSFDNPSNSAITSYYQIGPKSIRSTSLLELLEKIIEEPMYYRLRTREQLSYTVTGYSLNNKNVLGYAISVNSTEDKNPTKHVIEKIHNFITSEVREILTTMTDKKFETFKDTSIRLKSLMDMELSTEVERNWSEITSREYLFDRAQKEINFLETCTKDDLLKFYEDHFESKTLRNLIFYVVAAKEEEEDGDANNDMDLENEGGDDSDEVVKTFDSGTFATFKDNFELYPYLKTIL